MKQIAQNYKSGELTVLDVPAPGCRAGGVLVRSLFSLISTGTEMMKVTEAKMSMVGQARARPDQVRKVLDSVAQQVVRLLVAAGVKVVGLDVLPDRCALAEKAGAVLATAPTEEGLTAAAQALARVSGGLGADHVLLAAGGSSNGPVEAAARLAR